MKTLSLILASALPLTALAACSEIEEEPPAVVDQGVEINDLIIGYPELLIADPQPQTPIECTEDCQEDGQQGEQYCTYARYTETQNFSEFVAFQPDSAALWPGSIVQGADAQHGFYTPVGVARAPLTFSMSLENLKSSPVGRMDNPTLSEFREKRNEILSRGVTGATPASIDFEVTQIHSDSQISLALGASVLWPGGSNVTAGFAFDSSEKRTKILVNYTQAYYTIDIDSPVEPKDFFGPDVTVEQLTDFMSAENPPTYVQSITYGRRVVFSVESNETADKVRASLEAAYEAGVNVDVDLKVEYENILRESRIHAFVLGGSGAEAAGAIAGFEGLIAYITKGGDYSKDSPGAPIAYKLAYLDNATTKLSFTTQYTERDCVRNRATLHADLLQIDHIGGTDPGDNLELYGGIGIRFPTQDSEVIDCDTGGEVVYLWELEDGQWLEVEEFSTWTPTSSTYVDLYDLPVGPEQKICLFADFWEEDGATFELSGDDDFGSFERLIGFETGWSGDHVLQPRGDGQNALDVRLHIDIQ
jgi:thiol-activated cytolysin